MSAPADLRRARARARRRRRPRCWRRSAWRGRSAPRAAAAPRRILLLRLERIGDLLMVLDAIADVARACARTREIDLAVGSWNAPLARADPRHPRVETLDVPWLAREGDGLTCRRCCPRRVPGATRRYDLAINFEPDIRSNLLARPPARLTAGYWTGGGGALLDVALDVRPARAHDRQRAAARRRACLGARGRRATAAPLD